MSFIYKGFGFDNVALMRSQLVQKIHNHALYKREHMPEILTTLSEKYADIQIVKLDRLSQKYLYTQISSPLIPDEMVPLDNTDMIHNDSSSCKELDEAAIMAYLKYRIKSISTFLDIQMLYSDIKNAIENRELIQQIFTNEIIHMICIYYNWQK